MNDINTRLRNLEQALRHLSRELAGALERIKRLEDRMAQLGGGGGAGGGGAGGVYYADGLGIAGNSTGTGTVYQSWDDTNLGTKDIINKLPDDTTATKRQLLIRNPDGTYCVIAESCADF